MQSNVINTAEAFAKKHNFQFVIHKFKKQKLWGGGKQDPEENEKWLRFKNKPGVYIISNENEVIYIGQSNRNYTGRRLFKSLNDPEKMQYCSDKTDVTILTFLNKHFTCALESYLIEQYNPISNKQLKSIINSD